MNRYRRDGIDAHPDRNARDYGSTRLRHPTQPLIPLTDPETELSQPFLGSGPVGELDSDLTAQHDSDPIGERIIVSGQVRDGNGQPLREQLVEIWQANAAGRYLQKEDRHPAPLDPNFTGIGRCLTDDEGRYHFTTIKPGPYPWKNHHNAWRPAHIHFSLFGTAFVTRLITQMYFPGDPLFAYDPILKSVSSEHRQRLVSQFDLDLTEPEWATGYRWDIVLRGKAATQFDAEEEGT